MAAKTSAASTATADTGSEELYVSLTTDLAERRHIQSIQLCKQVLAEVKRMTDDNRHSLGNADHFILNMKLRQPGLLARNLGGEHGVYATPSDDLVLQRLPDQAELDRITRAIERSGRWKVDYAHPYRIGISYLWPEEQAQPAQSPGRDHILSYPAQLEVDHVRA